MAARREKSLQARHLFPHVCGGPTRGGAASPQHGATVSWRPGAEPSAGCSRVRCACTALLTHFCLLPRPPRCRDHGFSPSPSRRLSSAAVRADLVVSGPTSGPPAPRALRHSRLWPGPIRILLFLVPCRPTSGAWQSHVGRCPTFASGEHRGNQILRRGFRARWVERLHAGERWVKCSSCVLAVIVSCLPHVQYEPALDMWVIFEQLLARSLWALCCFCSGLFVAPSSSRTVLMLSTSSQ